jgi:glucose-6-phosphate isomerase
MLPAGISLSRDLHSLGQFFQQGRQIFSETLISVAEPAGDVVVGADGGFFAGRGMNEFNGAVRAGMMRAHRDAGIPIITVEAPDMSAHSFGLLVYLFEVTCGVTGLLMGVDPFNQPGVEAYKKEMMAILRK